MSSWLTQHHDLVLKVVELKRRILATNLCTQATITIGAKPITRSIADWVIRRRELIDLEVQAWESLTDRNLAEGRMNVPGGDAVYVRIERFFDPKERDRKVEELKREKEDIDAQLEIVNATTELAES